MQFQVLILVSAVWFGLPWPSHAQTTEVAKVKSEAEKGDVLMQFQLACMFELGVGVEPNLIKAAQWYQKAGARGLDEAQIRLGLMFDAGRGIRKSDREAAVWYLKAAEQNHPLAQTLLGLKYAGVKDDVKAYKWLSLATRQGNSDAAQALDAVFLTMTPDEVERGIAQLNSFTPIVQPISEQARIQREKQLTQTETVE